MTPILRRRPRQSRRRRRSFHRPPAVPTGSDQYEQLQDELARRGVLFQSLEGPDDHGVWSFTCGVPKHGDPNSIHRVEVSAVGDRGLPAMRAAVEQIDREVP